MRERWLSRWFQNWQAAIGGLLFIARQVASLMRSSSNSMPARCKARRHSSPAAHGASK